MPETQREAGVPPVEQAWTDYCYRSRANFEIDEKAAFLASWDARSVALPSREQIAAAVMDTRWPDGERLTGITNRTAGMIADAVLALLSGKES